MKLTFILISFLYSSFLFSQAGNIGINTPLPKARLDISAKSTINPENSAGMLFPTITKFPTVDPGTDQNGMLVYLDSALTPNLGASGLYFWDHSNNRWQFIYQTKVLTNNLFKVVYSASPAFSSIQQPNVWYKTSFNSIDTPDPNFKINTNGDIVIGSTGTYSIIFTGGIKTEASSTSGVRVEIGIFKNTDTSPTFSTQVVLTVPDNLYRSTNTIITGVISLIKGDIITIKTRQTNFVGSNPTVPATNYSLILSNLN